jgi:hypothetical protein
VAPEFDLLAGQRHDRRPYADSWASLLVDACEKMVWVFHLGIAHAVKASKL